MALIKMGTAARRARMGSTNTARRALLAAGVPLVTVSPGVWAVEEQDLDRFLRERQEKPVSPPPQARPKPAGADSAEGSAEKGPKARKRRS